MITIRIIPNDKGNPPGKLADAELHFTDTPLAGLKLIGFGIWENRAGHRTVTFPARQYSVNGERRSFALLRPVNDTGAQSPIRDAILHAYVDYEQPDQDTHAAGQEQPCTRQGNQDTTPASSAILPATPKEGDTTKDDLF